MIAASSEQLFLSPPQSLFGTVPPQGDLISIFGQITAHLCFFCCFFIGNGKKRVLLPEMIAHLFLFHILLTFYFLNPLYFLMLPFKFTITTGSAGNVRSYIPLQSRNHSRNSAGPNPAQLRPAPGSPWLPPPQACRAPSCGKGIPCPYATT